MATNVEQEKAKLAALKLMVELVRLVAVSDDEWGTPSGPLYAALMSKGCSYSLYTTLIGSLTSVGWIRQSNNCLFVTEAGKTMLQKAIV